jgi:hypothetical protein
MDVQVKPCYTLKSSARGMNLAFPYLAANWPHNSGQAANQPYAAGKDVTDTGI